MCVIDDLDPQSPGGMVQQRHAMGVAQLRGQRGQEVADHAVGRAAMQNSEDALLLRQLGHSGIL